MQATAREALEQVNGVFAFEQLTRERHETTDADNGEPAVPLGAAQPAFIGGAVLSDDGQSLSHPSSAGRHNQVTITGPAAEKVADVPHLTGGSWPEWDALELAETDPTKEPLKIRW